MHRVRGRVCARAGDDGSAIAHLVHGDLVQLEPLVVGERRRLAGRPGNDEAVRPVLDQVARERAESLEVDRPVRLEGRDDRGEDLSEHVRILRDRRAGQKNRWYRPSSRLAATMTTTAHAAVTAKKLMIRRLGCASGSTSESSTMRRNAALNSSSVEKGASVLDLDRRGFAQGGCPRRSSVSSGSDSVFRASIARRESMSTSSGLTRSSVEGTPIYRPGVVRY